MKIAIILGSTRPGRFGAQVADWVMAQAAGRDDAEYELVDLADYGLVLLDEPVAHLDTPTGAAVLQDLLESAEGRTVVMVSHHDVGTDGFDRSVVLSPPKEP